MIYRVRTYEILPQRLDEFNGFFHRFLLPNQLKFGTNLIGRWVNTDKTKLMAIWEYQTKDHYYQIEEQIKQTELHKLGQEHRKRLEPLYLSTKQEFWKMTGDYTKGE